MFLIQYNKYYKKKTGNKVSIVVTDITHENNDNNSIIYSMINTLIHAKYIQTSQKYIYITNTSII